MFVCSLCSIRANAAVVASVRISDPPVHLLICYGRRLKLVAARPALLNHIAGRDRLRDPKLYDSFKMPTIPLSCGKQAGGKQTARQVPGASPSKDQSRKTRAGSVRVARQAGRRQAATEVIVITAVAEAKASGSFGLTL